MATSLLQLLRMRPLKSVSWGVLRSPLAASLCTQAGDPAKPVKRAKTASKTAGAPDERARLLAYKTPVAFPVRFSEPDVFLPQFPGVPDQVDSFTATAETAVPPASTSDLAVTANKKSADLDDESSSSSDSDSDSDSDSEDEKSEIEPENKSLPPDSSGSAVKKEAEVQEITRKQNYKQDTPFHVSEAVPEATPAAAVEMTEADQASVEILSESSEVLVDSAPESCVAIESSPILEHSTEAASTAALDAQTQPPAKVETEPEHLKSVPADVGIETTQPALDVASAEDETPAAEVTAENPIEICTQVDSAKELVDHAPVITEAVEEKLQAESEAEPSQEAAAVPPSEPEEPFDNSTYKNYQHHSYTPYTFVDQDVEMAKFRLPQPSSGRPSPRH